MWKDTRHITRETPWNVRRFGEREAECKVQDKGAILQFQVLIVLGNGVIYPLAIFSSRAEIITISDDHTQEKIKFNIKTP